MRTWSLFQRAHLLVILGRDEELAALLPELDRLPPGVGADVRKRELKLARAFYADRTDDLPGPLALDEWSRDFAKSEGDSLIYLSWAAWRRGDEETARRVLADGLASMNIPLHRSQPKLHAWMDERRKAWSMV